MSTIDIDLSPRPIGARNIDRSIEKAVRARKMSEPHLAESICRDVLRIDPEHQDARRTMVLALTDQFLHAQRSRLAEASEHVGHLTEAYERAYFAGIVQERLAWARLRKGGPNSGTVAYECFRTAMDHYEEAEGLSGEDNDDALLRWNACVRGVQDRTRVSPLPDDDFRPFLE